MVLLAGCGLAPDGDARPGPAAGNAPWTDLGAATVCSGETALAPPASPPGGLCVRDSFVAAACATDRDCASRESCFCGRCTVTFCAVASDCEAPRFCNFSQHRCDLACVADTDCATGEVCLGGVCRARCLESTDCQFGEVCEANTCIGDDCSADTDCQAGERCDLQRIPQQVQEPSVVVTGGRTVLYLDLADPAAPDARAIFRAVSTDGTHFTLDPAAPVIAGRAPSVVIDGATTYLYFEDPAGTGVLVATSADGIAFDPPTLALAAPDARAPSAVHAGGEVLLYFATAGSIALATGPIGGELAPAGIVLSPADVQIGDGTPGTPFWTPVTELASPHALIAGPDGATSVHLWFSAFGTESALGTKFGVPEVIPPNYSIGFAAADPASPGALAVWPYGPVADRIDVFLTHLDELGPAVVEPRRGVFRLYFVDATHDAMGVVSLGRLGILGSGGSL